MLMMPKTRREKMLAIEEILHNISESTFNDCEGCKKNYFGSNCKCLPYIKYKDETVYCSCSTCIVKAVCTSPKQPDFMYYYKKYFECSGFYQLDLIFYIRYIRQLFSKHNIDLDQIKKIEVTNPFFIKKYPKVGDILKDLNITRGDIQYKLAITMLKDIIEKY